ncbi:hypothetical protein NDU88_005406 [Pleurodeles waltl]|uniref:Uncharacterized protein n=1 Tax=Pleurodeles waltl TaxID=8319 RepID=A0AAV7TBW0_PLEWA|nr:hypothetical protein NDU88_005406 [Pleurodeles waltl]
MATANGFEDLKEAATCSICLEYIRDPVTIDCGHNFCRTCITQCWEGRDENLPCPQCRRVSQGKELRSNWQLRSIVEVLQQQEENMCVKHKLPLQLFCEKDQELICLVCRESVEHKIHCVSPIEEAAQNYKTKLLELLSPLKKKMESKIKEEEQHKTTMVKLGTEMQKIVAEIEQLRSLLREKEQSKLEMDHKMTMAEKADKATLSSQIASLESLVVEIEQKCKEPASELLKDVGSTLSRCSGVRFQKPDPEVKNKPAQEVKNPKGKAKCVRYYTFPKLGPAVRNCQVSLDIDTMHPDLALIDQRRGVMAAYKKQLLSDNPKRFTSSRCVMGSAGIISGKHYWEVRIDLNTREWVLGVAAESVNRKGVFTWSPKEGVWAVKGGDNECWALGDKPVRLPLRNYPWKIGIYLDYEGGQLSFYNLWSFNHLYTFTGAAFTQRIFPFFSLDGGMLTLVGRCSPYWYLR